jgi:hypothetical protein
MLTDAINEDRIRGSEETHPHILAPNIKWVENGVHFLFRQCQKMVCSFDSF